MDHDARRRGLEDSLQQIAETLSRCDNDRVVAQLLNCRTSTTKALNDMDAAEEGYIIADEALALVRQVAELRAQMSPAAVRQYMYDLTAALIDRAGGQ